MHTTQGSAKNKLLASVILMDLLAGMELDLFVPSFPELQEQFTLSVFWVEASLSLNFLGYCLSLFWVGVMADRYGRKPMISLGLIIFTFGCLLCLWAPYYSVFLLGRFLQGIGIAAPCILSFLIIADSYPLKQQQFYIAMLNGLKNAAIAAAPVIGSYVTLYFHWRGNFTLLLIFGIVTLLMSVAFVPSYKLPTHKETLSFKSYAPLFRSAPMRLLMLHIVFLFVPYWIFVGISPLLYMEDLHVSLSHFGYYQGVLALAFALGSVAYGFLVHRFDKKNMLWISNGLLCVSIVFLITLAFQSTTPPLFITLALLFFVMGQIVPSTIIYPICLNFIPSAKGRISGLVNAGSLIFQSLGLQLAGFYYAGFRNGGFIIAGFILLIVISSFWVIRREEVSDLLEER